MPFASVSAGGRCDSSLLQFYMNAPSDDGQMTVASRANDGARMAALLGERERAVNTLRNYRGVYDIGPHREFDFESLRDYPPFQELVRPKG